MLRYSTDMMMHSMSNKKRIKDRHGGRSYASTSDHASRSLSLSLVLLSSTDDRPTSLSTRTASSGSSALRSRRGGKVNCACESEDR